MPAKTIRYYETLALLPTPARQPNNYRHYSTADVVCCFTPILVIVFGAVGLGWVTGYLDVVLLPALAVFLSLTAYALWRNGHAA